MTPPTIGFVHNARSERNKQGFRDLEPIIGATPGLVRLDFDAAHSLAEVARELARMQPALIVINGGDGTVQGLLTAMLEDRRMESIPPIAILPRGMANMTANDCGLRSKGPRALQRLLDAARDGTLYRHVVHRHVLRVANIEEGPAEHGMFMGALGIYDAIQHCKAHVHTRGLKGGMANSTTLASLLLQLAIGRRPPGMLGGEEVEIATDAGLVRRGRELLLLATTLDRLVVASRPFWNTGSGRVRFTTIGYPPEHLLRSAYAVLWGRDRSRLPESYLSFGTDRVEIAMASRFTIDGQFFTPLRNRPVTVTAPDELRFVRL